MSKYKSPRERKLPTTKTITPEQTIIIIRLIKKYKCIWDKQHPDFRKNHIRNAAFEKIGGYFNLTAEDVSRKYRRFRNVYIQELKLMRENKKSFSNLFYFDEMDFLRDTVEHRSSYSKLTKSKTEPEQKPDETVDEENDNDNDVEFPMESLEDDCSLGSVERSTFSSNDSNHSSKEPQLEFEEIKQEITEIPYEDEILNVVVDELGPEMVDLNDECPSVLISSEKDSNDLQNQKTSRSNVDDNDDDEFEIFSKYISSQLKSMDKLSALETMEELQTIILKRKIQILREKQSKN